MVFSSLVFLFLFLPLIIGGYFLVPVSWRNFFLLCGSIFFYAWGEGAYALLMLLSILANYLFGLLLASRQTIRQKKLVLAMAVAVNLSPLLFFKYIPLIGEFFNVLSSRLGLGLSVGPLSPHLPIGISFFTFQALSYVIDVYRETSKPQKSLINMGLYISFFPQLIAGPIIRYHDIAREIMERRVTPILFSEGVSRFIFGLAKKVLLANPMASMVDAIFSLPLSDVSPAILWLGVLCYSLQIYFDFSGYSDMAIGLGRMFGFHFLENFNYPFIAKSIREFWKRWHISLSNWFMDYLYIPLGGNRKGTARTYFNLLTIFVLCGLWHGANWNYLLWGLFHGLFMVLERGSFGRIMEKLPAPVQHAYFIFFLLNSWILFRVESLSSITHYYKTMYGLHNPHTFITPVINLLDLQFIITFFVGLVVATPLFNRIAARLATSNAGGGMLYNVSYNGGQLILLAVLFLASWLNLASGAYNPFIYFRF